MRDLGPHKVLVVADHDGRDWASQLTEDLQRLGARAARLTEADAVAVVLHRVAAELGTFALHERCGGLADIRKALTMQVPVTPVLGGAAQVAGTRFRLPASIAGLQFRVAVALPGVSAVPEVAAQLVAAAIRARTRPSVKRDRGPSIARKPPGEPPRKSSVFISYRRDDTELWSGELAKELSALLGPGRVFFDVGSGAPGLDFRDLIDDAMAESSSVVVVIGSAYLAVDSEGARRIDREHDWVRAELRAAIASGKLLRVVLVGSARSPAREALPADIRALADATVLGTIRTGGEVKRVLAGIVAGTHLRRLVTGGQTGPVRLLSGLRGDLGAAWHVKAVRDGLCALGWALEDADLQQPQRLMHARHPRFRFEIKGGDSVVILEERDGSQWVCREVFSIVGAGLQRTGVMQLERRLVEAAVEPNAFLDRTGRKKLSKRKHEWPAGLDPVHYSLRQHVPLPVALEAWNRSKRHIRTAHGLERLAQEHSIGLRERPPVDVAFTPSGQRIVALTGWHVELIDAGSGERVASREQTRNWTWTALDVSRDGRLALGSFDGRITVLEASLQPCVDVALPQRWLRSVSATVKGELPNRIHTVSWSSSGAYVAAATESDVWILNLAAEAFTRFRIPRDKHPSIGHFGARFIGATDDVVAHARLGHVWIVDARTGEVGGQLEPAWLPDPEWKNRDVSDAELLRRSLGIIRTAVPSPDGAIIALAGSDGQVGFGTPAASMHVESVCAWHEPTVVTAGNDVQAIAFDPRGRRLAVVASTPYLVIGDLDDQRPVAYGTASSGLALTTPRVTWSPDGRRVALVADLPGGGLHVWTVA